MTCAYHYKLAKLEYLGEFIAHTVGDKNVVKEHSRFEFVLRCYITYRLHASQSSAELEEAIDHGYVRRSFDFQGN